MSTMLRRVMLAMVVCATLGVVQLAKPCAAQSWWTVGYPPYSPAYPTRYFPGPFPRGYDPRFNYPTRFYPNGLFAGRAFYQGYGIQFVPANGVNGGN